MPLPPPPSSGDPRSHACDAFVKRVGRSGAGPSPPAASSGSNNRQLVRRPWGCGVRGSRAGRGRVRAGPS